MKASAIFVPACVCAAAPVARAPYVTGGSIDLVVENGRVPDALSAAVDRGRVRAVVARVEIVPPVCARCSTAWAELLP